MPTASVQTSVFLPLVTASTMQKGIPNLRLVFVPQPVMGKSAAELRGYIDGPDAVTGRPFMDEVIDALTKPLTDAEAQGEAFDRSTPRLAPPDTEENLNQLFLEENWTDKLPIVMPTEERVAAMLAGTSHKPDEVVGRMRPTGTREAWEFTVEKVAVNAVMAGSKPEYLPVILALAASQVTARGSTTSSAAGMAVVNGPIRHEIDMNWGIGAMGPYNHANATIGRAYGLLSQNLQGGSLPGVTYLGSQGNNYAYNSITFPENEERSPWEPFHVQHGFRSDESAVSVFSGNRSTAFQLGLREKHWREHVRNMLRGMNPHTSPTFILDPITAVQFVDRGGFDRKEKLIRWVHENATMPAGEYWDYQLIENYVAPRALNGVEPYATMLKANEDEMIRVFPEDRIHVVVVGGETNGYWRIMGCNYGKSVSVDVWR
ncbi:MAG: UGSC family (seleno)protein [Candidatus Latescibacteria bacterium]|nr:UGSC family (seleno)protein [Candidatus Latescibacterota bacterium]